MDTRAHNAKYHNSTFDITFTYLLFKMVFWVVCEVDSRVHSEKYYDSPNDILTDFCSGYVDTQWKTEYHNSTYDIPP